MCTSAVSLMDLDRGTLARIYRKLLAGLGDGETFRTLRVRVSAPCGRRGGALEQSIARTSNDIAAVVAEGIGPQAVKNYCP